MRSQWLVLPAVAILSILVALSFTMFEAKQTVDFDVCVTPPEHECFDEGWHWVRVGEYAESDLVAGLSQAEHLCAKEVVVVVGQKPAGDRYLIFGNVPCP